MSGAVREKRVLVVLLCDLALMFLMFIGLVGCLLFWLGTQLYWKPVLQPWPPFIDICSGTYSLIDWEIPPSTGSMRWSATFAPAFIRRPQKTSTIWAPVKATVQELMPS